MGVYARDDMCVVGGVCVALDDGGLVLICPDLCCG